MQGPTKGFGISSKNEITEELLLKPEDYELFGVKVPDDMATTVGIIMEKNKGNYFCSWDIIQSVVHLGVKVVFLANLDPINISLQMKCLDALVIPDGDFLIPGEYYAEKVKDRTSARTDMLLDCLVEASVNDIKVLGIGRGALFLAGYAGLFLTTREFVETPFHHENGCHDIEIERGSPLYEIFKAPVVKVNSHHKEFLAPDKLQKERMKSLPLAIYACARDGMSEAWGSENCLGVLWNPERLAVKGDAFQKKIFKWLIE